MFGISMYTDTGDAHVYFAFEAYFTKSIDFGAFESSPIFSNTLPLRYFTHLSLCLSCPEAKNWPFSVEWFLYVQRRGSSIKISAAEWSLDKWAALLRRDCTCLGKKKILPFSPFSDSNPTLKSGTTWQLTVGFPNDRSTDRLRQRKQQFKKLEAQCSRLKILN